MATDREARMLAAGDTIIANEKEYRLRPVRSQQLCDLEKDALAFFIENYLETYKRNAEILGSDYRSIIERKLDEVARWDVSNLPSKKAFDCSRIPATDKIKEWVKSHYDVPDDASDITYIVLIATALDSEEITEQQVRDLSGKLPRKGSVRYDQWWVTGSARGMISFIYNSIRIEHPEVTLEEISNWPFTKLAEAARKVEKITTTSMGNG